jgi:hypothetical protein
MKTGSRGALSEKCGQKSGVHHRSLRKVTYPVASENGQVSRVNSDRSGPKPNAKTVFGIAITAETAYRSMPYTDSTDTLPGCRFDLGE